jgi:aminoglycoside phosphotransferase (APT) family kinase protein
MPTAEVDIDEALVRGLLVDQYPDLAELRLVEVANGWDNVLYRLGPDLTIRLPRRQVAATLVEHEQRWLPVLAPSLPLPVPTPVRIGRPALGYPWAWSVCLWLPGDVAAGRRLDEPGREARRLGHFVRALHQPAPNDAPFNPVRGRPLADRAPAVAARIDQLGDTVNGSAVAHRWVSLVATRPWERPPVWIHGDLHPANVLVDKGRIAGIIDFGDLSFGDPATDLAVAWMLFHPAARIAFRDACGEVDDDTWARAQGWALHLALAFLANSADNPIMAAIGRRTLAAVLADAS